MSNNLNIMNSSVQKKSNLIWGIAEIIRDFYKEHEYGRVILPFTVLKRFDDVYNANNGVARTKVIEKYTECKEQGIEAYNDLVMSAGGLNFYNTSNFTFKSLLHSEGTIYDDFKDYLNGFSKNVQDILNLYDFSNIVGTLHENRLLYPIITEFNKKDAYLGLDEVSTVEMGYIFENLVKRFSESYNEAAGAHFTARDIIDLMVDVMVAEDEESLSSRQITKTVYDMTMGTSQMLSCMEDRLKEIDNQAEIECFGQELNRVTCAIAQSERLLRNKNDVRNMKLGNTLTNDAFEGVLFDYIISNPPFGVDWKKDKDFMISEHNRKDDGRFEPGLPPTSDGQLLFVLNGLKKLKDTGKMAIINNGSSLFSGKAGSGQSEIRKYFISDNDWLDCIVQMPKDNFYNTNIITYILFFNKNKNEKRRNKVQLIDASNCFVPMQSSVGKKRVIISNECRDFIVSIYKNYENGIFENNGLTCESKILNKEDLLHYEFNVKIPQKDENGEIIKKGKKTLFDTDTEIVPYNTNIEEYFNTEVLPNRPDAILDKDSITLGCEISFTKIFYKYIPPRKTEDILFELSNVENDITLLLKSFNKEE